MRITLLFLKYKYYARPAIGDNHHYTPIRNQKILSLAQPASLIYQNIILYEICVMSKRTGERGGRMR